MNLTCYCANNRRVSPNYFHRHLCATQDVKFGRLQKGCSTWSFQALEVDHSKFGSPRVARWVWNRQSPLFWFWKDDHLPRLLHVETSFFQPIRLLPETSRIPGLVEFSPFSFSETLIFEVFVWSWKQITEMIELLTLTAQKKIKPVFDKLAYGEFGVGNYLAKKETRHRQKFANFDSRLHFVEKNRRIRSFIYSFIRDKRWISNPTQATNTLFKR